MFMYVRFIVHQQLGKSKQASGVFVAAAHLLEQGEPSPEERERIEVLLEWFRLNLPVPPRSQQDERAIYWYKSWAAKEHISKMWELTHILNAHSYQVERITTEFAGLAVYQDEFQVGAIPRTDRHA